jgi:hypothetical protein
MLSKSVRLSSRTAASRARGRVARSLAAGGLALSLAACGGVGQQVEQTVQDGAASAQQTVLRARIDLVEAQIVAGINLAACTSDAQCRALPIGAMACGGPGRYLAYSISNTDEGTLAGLAADHRRLSAELLAAQQAIGPCVMVEPGRPSCELLTCRLR